MTDVVFCFEVHQPYRLRRGRFRDAHGRPSPFDEDQNRRILERVAARCYRPMNALLADLIEATDGRFRCAFSISGTALAQLRAWSPETLAGFVALADTGCVEFLAETSMHSLTFDIDPAEWERQIRSHRAEIAELFGREPTTFRNTEMVVDEWVARRVEDFGFEVLLGEGADQLLGSRSPMWVWRPRGCAHLRLLLRSHRLADDIGFRFSDKSWSEYPLFADKYAGWLHAAGDVPFIGLFMDYETFGEHQSIETGIFDFMRALPSHVLEDERFGFATPAEAAQKHAPIPGLEIPRPFSWADQERDLSAWRGNLMQRVAAAALRELGPRARLAAAVGRGDLLESWRRMTTSDHAYYMSTKHTADGRIHACFSPYPGPREAYINFMDALDDLGARIDDAVVTAGTDWTETDTEVRD